MFIDFIKSQHQKTHDEQCCQVHYNVISFTKVLGLSTLYIKNNFDSVFIYSKHEHHSLILKIVSDFLKIDISNFKKLALHEYSTASWSAYNFPTPHNEISFFLDLRENFRIEI